MKSALLIRIRIADISITKKAETTESKPMYDLYIKKVPQNFHFRCKTKWIQRKERRGEEEKLERI